MNVLILGSQGSGKGTQAKLLAEKFGLFYFEAGEFLREIALKNEKLKEILDKGELVDEKELSSYVMAFFDEKQIYDDIIFDGFPREVGQYKFFKNWLKERNAKIEVALVLVVSEKTTFKRLALRAREDDTADVIKQRLKLYKTETLPLIAELKKESKVIEIDGEASVAKIFKDICKKLK